MVNPVYTPSESCGWLGPMRRIRFWFFKCESFDSGGLRTLFFFLLLAETGQYAFGGIGRIGTPNSECGFGFWREYMAYVVFVAMPRSTGEISIRQVWRSAGI